MSETESTTTLRKASPHPVEIELPVDDGNAELQEDTMTPDEPSVAAEARKPNAGNRILLQQALQTRTHGEPAKQPGHDDTIVHIHDFSAWYSDFRVLHTLNLDIPVRSVTAFIGPSGCGKTTLLRWINRMNDTVPGAHASGMLEVGNLNILAPDTDVVLLRQRVGMVFQKPNPFPKSIYDNIAFGPRLHLKINKTDLDDLVEWSLRKAALWDEVKDRLRHNALGLSGGQQQRLCIARAIATGPEVVLMDEPASSLDPRSAAAIEDLITELREDYTIIIVTHNMQQAARVSDRTAFLYEGKLIEYGDTTQLFTNPEQKQTEDYITGRFG